MRACIEQGSLPSIEQGVQRRKSLLLRQVAAGTKHNYIQADVVGDVRLESVTLAWGEIGIDASVPRPRPVFVSHDCGADKRTGLKLNSDEQPYLASLLAPCADPYFSLLPRGGGNAVLHDHALAGLRPCCTSMRPSAPAQPCKIHRVSPAGHARQEETKGPWLANAWCNPSRCRIRSNRCVLAIRSGKVHLLPARLSVPQVSTSWQVAGAKVARRLSRLRLLYRQSCAGAGASQQAQPSAIWVAGQLC